MLNIIPEVEARGGERCLSSLEVNQARKYAFSVPKQPFNIKNMKPHIEDQLTFDRIIECWEDLDKLFSGFPIKFDDGEVPGLRIATSRKMIAASSSSAVEIVSPSIAYPSTPVTCSFALDEGPFTPTNGPFTPMQYTPTQYTPNQALYTPQPLKAPLVEHDIPPVCH